MAKSTLMKILANFPLVEQRPLSTNKRIHLGSKILNSFLSFYPPDPLLSIFQHLQRCESLPDMLESLGSNHTSVLKVCSRGNMNTAIPKLKNDLRVLVSLRDVS